jgi:hypothetical protein
MFVKEDLAIGSVYWERLCVDPLDMPIKGGTTCSSVRRIFQGNTVLFL